MSGTLYLQCRAQGEPRSTLNTAFFSKADNEEIERWRLHYFAMRWSAQDGFGGHDFRVVGDLQISAERAVAEMRREEVFA